MSLAGTYRHHWEPPTVVAMTMVVEVGPASPILKRIFPPNVYTGLLDTEIVKSQHSGV